MDRREPAPAVDRAALRRARERQDLHRSDLDPDPFVQFRAWFDDAVAAELHQPEAMVVATATAAAEPSARLVLLRGADDDGFVFFTNYESRKGHELDANPAAALLFPWNELSRQVRISGPVERLSEAASDAYFASRARGSQLSAWASPQSEVVADRAALDARWAEEEARWGDDAVPRPPFWGGFRVVPREYEFWQGRENRFHDRFRYRPVDADGAGAPRWVCERLAP